MNAFDNRIYFEEQKLAHPFSYLGDYRIFGASDPLVKVQLFDKLLIENMRLKVIIQNLLEQRSEKTCLRDCCNYNLSSKEPFSIFTKKEMVKTESNTQNFLFQPSNIKIETDYKTLHESTDIKQFETAESLFSTSEKEDNINSPSSTSFKEKEDDCSQNLSSVGIRKRKCWKSSKESEKKKEAKIRPDTKHLWISYGRAIHSFALENTEGEIKEKIEGLKGKLTSKTEYSEVFMITEEDSPEEINFKRVFGKVALKFLSEETQKAFLNSKFRHELLSQKGRVTDWITYLIEPALAK